MKTLSAKAKISGLTLIELLVVICVIAVLAALLFPWNDAHMTDTNISYFAGVDATLNNPKSILSGDRNLQVDDTPAKPGLLVLAPKSQVGWTEELHYSKSTSTAGGNILFADGHVEFIKSKALNSVFQSQDSATNRFAIP